MATRIDCASSDARTLAFLIETLGEGRIVFGSDYCGGQAFAAIDQQPDPARVQNSTERNSRKLLRV